MEANSKRIPPSKRIVINDAYGDMGRKKCLDIAVERIENNCPIYYIVPSRESMFDVRQQLIQRLGGLFGCQVFGFADFEKLLAGDTLECLSGDRQMALIEGIAQSVEEDTLFFAVKNKPGFTKRLKSTLIQLGRLLVDSQRWMGWLETVSPDESLAPKLSELGKLYRRYEEKKIELQVIDVNDYGKIAIEAIKDPENKPEIFNQEITIIIDGFMNIDEIDKALLSAIEENVHGATIYESRPFEDKEIATKVTVANSPCMDHEIRQVGGKIKELILEKGVTPKKIGVIIPQNEPYTEMILKIFDEYGIPVGMRRHRGLDGYPLIKAIFAEWIERENRLEGNESERLNRLHLQLTNEAYQPFLNEVTQLYLGDSLDGNGQLLQLKAYQSLVEAVEGRLQVADLSEGETEKEGILNKWTNLFHQLMVQQLSRSTAGIRLLDPDQIRGLKFHTLFFLGFNEGLFPGKSKRVTLFSDYENQWCANNGMAFGTDTYELERETHRFYSMLNSADRVHLSYRTADESGSLMIPSPFVEELKERVVINEDSFDIFTMRQRLEMNRRAYSEKEVSMINGLNQQGLTTACEGEEAIDKATLTDQPIQVYVTGLNEYAKCPFAYRAKRIWEVDVEDERSKRQLAIGIAQHGLLKDYFEKVKDLAIDTDYLEQLLERYVTQALLPEMSQDFVKDALEEMRGELRDFVVFESDNLNHYYHQTGKQLVPTYLEKAFTAKVDAVGTLRGRIDRIDLEIDEKSNYTGRFAIVDYKKGKCKGVMECIVGSDHQLFTYLEGAQSILADKLENTEPQVLGLLYDSVSQKERNGLIKTNTKPLFFSGRKGTKSTMGEKNWQVLLDWEKQNREAIVKSIRDGAFEKPHPCSEVGDYMGWCPYKHLCREES